MIPSHPLRVCAFARSLYFLSYLSLSVGFATAFALSSDDAISKGVDWKTHLDRSHLQQLPLSPVQKPQLPFSSDLEAGLDAWSGAETLFSGSSTYAALLDALGVMESHFFEIAHGTWPDAIDWTAAVMHTHISATLATMSEYSGTEDLAAPHAFSHENIINRYFTQVTSFYFGQNAFSLRFQAYDDMLWVVLGWLESIKFVNLHSNLHYPSTPSQDQHSQNSTWYARQFIPQFAHRARLFYDLASRGWDTTLCGGGMVWNPSLNPYKNAITNQLYIAASISMYLHFPGDCNASPFLSATKKATTNTTDTGHPPPPAKAHDPHYLQNAIKAYTWLKSSGMLNPAGLYSDGFHIDGWRPPRNGRPGSNGTGQCDLRDEMVYTYNQGVILSGLRGLWEATGHSEYLEDGHELVRNVIKATGWHERDTEQKYRWAGLGRGGILEEQCDWSGTCSQNGQTFKGIFFHHFSTFCAPLPEGREGDEDRPWLGDEETRTLHRQSCEGYGAWVGSNARAAWVTRDERGEFGQWWGRPAGGGRRADEEGGVKLEKPPEDEGGTDYRNRGVPWDEVWRVDVDDDSDDLGGPILSDNLLRTSDFPTPSAAAAAAAVAAADLNDRGRGRTVETQSGGVAVLRALWRLVDSRHTRRKTPTTSMDEL